jgi:Family of unknown function (DUF6444)/Transposase IS66 family
MLFKSEGTCLCSANSAAMERAEAEAILDGDRETAVALLMRVGELVEANRRLEARVAELERRLNRSSRNSSLPPSQDPPSAPPRPGRPGSRRKRGGQPGHEGRHRRLLPLERVDEVVEHWPEQCRSCARIFAERELVDAAEPWRHQVAELPPIAVTVTEHRLHGVCCPECATTTRAELPRELPRSAFGPRLQAAVVTLAVRNRVSRRDTTELARELFGVGLATGSVDAIIQRAGAALAAPHTRLEQEIRSAPVVNIDETGWKTAGGSRTLEQPVELRTGRVERALRLAPLVAYRQRVGLDGAEEERQDIADRLRYERLLLAVEEQATVGDFVLQLEAEEAACEMLACSVGVGRRAPVGGSCSFSAMPTKLVNSRSSASVLVVASSWSNGGAGTCAAAWKATAVVDRRPGAGRGRPTKISVWPVASRNPYQLTDSRIGPCATWKSPPRQ